jgi:uncharacterized protein
MSSIEPTTIPRGSLNLAAHLHLPDDFDQGARYPAIVLSTPGSSVKEQIGANYARRLAARGFVALVFDPAYQGESEGLPRDLESPAERVADLRHAVDYLQTQGFVDADRIGALGICAGGGYAVTASMTDHRIKALGTVVPVNIGRAFRGFVGSGANGIAGMLDHLAGLATAEATGGEPPRLPWLPDSLDDAKAAGIDDIDVLQAVRFYRTPRGRHENSTNRRHYRGDALILAFDAFHLADPLLTQPLQVVVGSADSSTGSSRDGHQLVELARTAEELLVIEGARHYEMYDEPRYVDQAVDCLEAFFSAHLGRRRDRDPTVA